VAIHGLLYEDVVDLAREHVPAPWPAEATASLSGASAETASKRAVYMP
jgi:hypothetical protein